ncbi:MAG: hypothetical protein K8F30_06035 [Taibaiella sp.]|nr:hypothetical protein [Taibaiella sp.]
MQLLKFILLASIFSFNNTKACMCVGGITIKSSYYSADIVVNATIINVKDLSERILVSENQLQIALKGVEYKAVVLRQYKGNKLTDTITIDPGPGSCEMPFHVGGNYLVFAMSDSDNVYYTTMCKGNRLYNKKDHKKLLKLERINSK